MKQITLSVIIGFLIGVFQMNYITPTVYHSRSILLEQKKCAELGGQFYAYFGFGSDSIHCISEAKEIPL